MRWKWGLTRYGVYAGVAVLYYFMSPKTLKEKVHRDIIKATEESGNEIIAEYRKIRKEIDEEMRAPKKIEGPMTSISWSLSLFRADSKDEKGKDT